MSITLVSTEPCWGLPPDGYDFEAHFPGEAESAVERDCDGQESLPVEVAG